MRSDNADADDDADLTPQEIAEIEQGLDDLRRNDVYVWDNDLEQFVRPANWEGLKE